MEKELLSIKEAAEWATKFLSKPVTESNIQYLVQYAKIKRCFYKNAAAISQNELKEYYEKLKNKEARWKSKLGNDLDWSLSFEQLKEADTTKHVHRLHPYKGKFIPQLVGYFLDDHLNAHKKNIFFKEGDIVLDPFMGSGTTLVQASELGLHSIGIDISDFNCLISKVKLDNYESFQLNYKLVNSMKETMRFSNRVFDNKFDFELKEKLSDFNKKYFPVPEFKNNLLKGEVNEEEYGKDKLNLFMKENKESFEKNGAKDKDLLINEKTMGNFISRWFSKRVRQEISYYLKLIEKETDGKIKNVMKIILSRAVRSCRATTHFDLATLKEPQFKPYYCTKHKKLCTPTNTLIIHLRRYTYDTIKRLKEFSKLKKEVYNFVIHGDSRQINILDEIKKQNPDFYKLLENKKIDGVFTSPPYVGQIDYHEQHAYAYELFEIIRKDNKEIGSMSRGKNKNAQEAYVEDISKVLINIKRFVKEDGNFFIVANDKFNLYPLIAKKSGLEIIDKFKRPVLNRTEIDRQPYAEIIFHMKKI